ncbi:MAG: VanW family protein, partial [Clostridiales bacterium]|nr:VanW family protein [Clostridiales bacterium]
MAQAINVFLIAVSVMIIFALVIIYRYSSNLLGNENVYAGVHVNSADVSGFTYDELLEFLNREFGGDLNEKEITIKVSDVTRTYSFSELGVSYDVESAAQEAFGVGRDGSPIKRLQDIAAASRDSVGVDMVFTYNHAKVDDIANAIAEEAGVLSEDAEVRYTPASVIIKPGRTGVSIDKDDLAEQLKAALESFESATIDVKLKMSEPDSLNADKIFNAIYKEPVDASYSVIDHRTVEILPESSGQIVDKVQLGNAIASLNSNSEDEVAVPLTKVEPAVKRADLEGAFFKDSLGAASTNFSVNSTNNKNRKTNMSLASDKINGFVMAPGDEFAFNEVVGQRTADAGYQMAGAFMNGQLLDDIGGGICQVSSTLYNAVLYADLEVSARQNHSYIVTYVTQGLDATVSYPQPDFKFKNSTGHPIRIDGGVDGTTISFSISGTQEGPKKKIELSSKLVSTTPFEEEITEDPTMPEGTRTVRQAGKNAYTIESYKTEKIGDEPAKTVKLATNKYKMMKQLVTVGTMPAPPGEPTPEPTVLMPAEGEENFVSDPQATAAGGDASGAAGATGAGGEAGSPADAAAG